MGKVSTPGNSLTPENTRVSENSFQATPWKLSIPKIGNFSGVSRSVSKAVSRCPSCGAVVNVRWERCLACKEPLLDAPTNSGNDTNIEPPEANCGSHSEMAAKQKHSSDSANMAHAPHSTWTGEAAERAEWFLSSEPPTEPFKLKQAVTVARPGPFWQHLRREVLAGPDGPRGRTGAVQDDLRCLYERFVDVERQAIQFFDGGGNADGKS